MNGRFLTISSALMVLSLAQANGQNQPKPDVTKQPTLFVVGYAHLDTQWRWEYPQVISEYIPKTMHTNFEYFEKYPHYIFNFSGANRYHMMKEYYPRDYEKVKDFIHAGRWYPAGSSMEESDVNSPSAESIFRQILYGNEFFRREFGVASTGYMLPDCFGFPASLPSILFHAGVKGFSTQKLTWGSSAPVGGPGSPEDTPEGIPFNVGMWIGPDGKGVISALNPGSYSGSITTDLSKSPTPTEEENRRNPPVDWPKRIELDGKATGVYADYHYYGTGDTGGAPSESSVKLLEAIVTKSETVLPPPGQFRAPWAQPASEPTGPEVRVGTGPVHVISSKADQMFLDITPAEAAHLLTYKGELELTNHSAGSLTSEAYQKRWNRKNEILADAAEQTSLAAQWLGGRKYPIDRLNEAWRLVMGGQFHDIMAGTATPKAYEYSWNDDVLAMNQFAQVVTSGTDAVSASLDTRTNGIPVVVFNQLSIPRQDVVEATLQFPEGTPNAVRVTGPDGREVPSQVEGTKILFLANVPSDGFAVYDVRPGESARASSELKVSESSLENARYRVKIDQNGDVSSIFDKQLNKELLAGPARLSFQYEQPQQWPAWNMDWEDQSKPPAGYVEGPAKIKVVENGPVRVAVQIDRDARGSHFVQTVRLSSGDPGNRVEFVNGIDWKTGQSALKAIFPLTASNPDATYNWEVGTIQRGNDTPRKFEYPSHEWFDLTDKSGSYGVTVLSDCKFASDKPNDNTLRLTLIYTPGVNPRMQQYSDQGTQDWGEHHFIYGLASHAGDWRRGETDWQGYRLNEPLLAFEATKHAGSLGRRFSLLNVSSNHVRVLALKKAEEGDDAVVRLVEVNGENEPNIHLKFGARVLAARELNAQEQPLGSANVSGGELVTSFTPFQVRTFAVKLGPAAHGAGEIASQPVTLAYDRDVTSTAGSHSNGGGFDAAGEALPAEMLPGEIHYSGITFKLGPAGGPNAVVSKGQTIDLPSGQFNRVYVLAASADGDQKATFRAGDTSADWTIENWTGFVGQWWARVWNEKVVNVPPRPLPPNIKPGSPEAQRFEAFMAQHRTRKALEFSGHINPGFIKPAPVAWFASHRHTADGQNEPYSYAYLFAYEMDVPAGTHSLTLPDNDKIRVMAVTVAQESSAVHPAQPLVDETPSEAASVPNGG